MSQLDLVIVNPASRKQVYQSLGEEFTAIEPPVWAGLYATFLRRKGFSVEIIDAEAEDLSHADAAQKTMEMSPRLVAVVVFGHQPSASTQNMDAAKEICASIKKLAPWLKVLILGGHVAALPHRTLQEVAADFACSGEGPYTLFDLLALLRSGSSSFDKVRGLVYREKNQIRTTKPAPLVRDLDREMPSVAWDLLPMQRYRAHNWHCFGGFSRKPYAALYTSLGCPFRCSFCCIQAPFKEGEQAIGFKKEVNSYRLWSPELVVGQIGHLVESYGVKNIKIADELFVLNPEHVHLICDLIIERGYELNIWAYARVDTIKNNMIEKLRKAGFRWLAFGIESASERVRDDVGKKFGQERIFQVIKTVRHEGINVIGNYIFGLPEDNLATMQETLNLAIELNTEFANFYCAMAYPGSSLFEEALKRGWPLPKSWTGYSQHAEDTLPLPTKYLTPAEVLAFRDKAFQCYFTNSRYLSMIQHKFGQPTVEHIKKMTSLRLKRKLISSNRPEI